MSLEAEKRATDKTKRKAEKRAGMIRAYAERVIDHTGLRFTSDVDREIFVLKAGVELTSLVHEVELEVAEEFLKGERSC